MHFFFVSIFSAEGLKVVTTYLFCYMMIMEHGGLHLGLLGGCLTHWTTKPLRSFEVLEVLVEVLILELPDEL